MFWEAGVQQNLNNHSGACYSHYKMDCLDSSLRVTALNGGNGLELSFRLPAPVGLAPWSEKLMQYCDPDVQDAFLNAKLPCP